MAGDDDILGLTGDSDLTPDFVFVREYLRTGDEKIACVRAGLTNSEYSLEVVAQGHLRRPEIQAAIAVLREAGVKKERPNYTRELLVDELQAAYAQAMASGQVSSGVSALKLQAQLMGYLDQTVNINHTVSVKEMSLSELEALVARTAPVALIEGEYTEVAGIGGVPAGEGDNSR